MAPLAAFITALRHGQSGPSLDLIVWVVENGAGLIHVILQRHAQSNELRACGASTR
jgi:hypothetical protein